MEQRNTIAELEEELSNQVQEEPEPVEETDGNEVVYQALAKLGGPTRAEVEALKETVPDLFFLPIDEKNIFIYRPLLRGEWIQFKHLFEKAGDSMNEDNRAARVVLNCLLWPQINELELPSVRAGTIDTLHEAIMLASDFLPTNLIINLAQRL